MANVNDLNFEVTFWKDNAKVLRIEGNFLIPNCIQTLVGLAAEEGQTFYTHAEVTHKNKVFFKVDLSNFSRSSDWLLPQNFV